MFLFGEKNPSGKLAETWPLCYEDVPGHETFGRGVNTKVDCRLNRW